MQQVWLLVPVGVMLFHATAAAASGCHKGTLFDLTYCTTDCPCGEGQGDCDADVECEPGLSCVRDVGAEYGVPSYVDVCRSLTTPTTPTTPATGKVFGQACKAAAECEERVCVPGSVDGGICSRGCAAAGDCPAGFECSSSVCQPRFASKDPRVPPNDTGSVFGAPCDLASECRSGLCAPEGFCTSRCSAAGEHCPVGSFCGESAICSLSPGDEAGGCSVAQPGSPGPVPAAPLLLLLLLARGQGTSNGRRRRSSR
jgi:hypothetical protein